MTERRNNDKVANVLEAAAYMMADSPEVEHREKASKLFEAARIIGDCPQDYLYPELVPDDHLPLEDKMVAFMSEIARMADGLDGWTNGVLHRKVRTYEGHPYHVIITDLDLGA